MTSDKQIYQALSNKIPAPYVNWAFSLWKSTPFTFVLSRNRSSKLGDYSYNRKNNSHRISVNRDLHPYSFLITYVHEVAHLQTVIDYGLKVSHHGKEWKLTFQKLLLVILHQADLPENLMRALADYAKNPRAASSSHTPLAQALSQFGPQKEGTTLKELPEGTIFIFRRRTYRKIETRRSRVMCECLDNGKRYLITGLLLIEDSSIKSFVNAI